MIYISCSEEQFKNILADLKRGTFCYFNLCDESQSIAVCNQCIDKHIKRINIDIAPDMPNYKTEAENTAFLQGFNVAVKRMRGEIK